MRRGIVIGFIVCYLLILGFGIFSHALGYKSTDHVGMYYLIWDMYCGWSGYEYRQHLVAQGVSGQQYELTPAPWGEFVPFGSTVRHNYDGSAVFTGTLASHILDHTEHEEIAHVWLIEEAWSKKYNLPDEVYEARYEEPKQKRSYYRTRLALAPNGKLLERYLDWTGYQNFLAITDNPRLVRDMASQPFMTNDGMISPTIRQTSHQQPGRRD